MLPEGGGGGGPPEGIEVAVCPLPVIDDDDELVVEVDVMSGLALLVLDGDTFGWEFEFATLTWWPWFT